MSLIRTEITSVTPVLRKDAERKQWEVCAERLCAEGLVPACATRQSSEGTLVSTVLSTVSENHTEVVFYNCRTIFFLNWNEL